MNYGGGSQKTHIAMLIVCNVVLLILFTIFYYLFTIDQYPGNFWEWSWDVRYSFKDYGKTLKEIDTNAGLAWMFFWVPLFFINGIALVVWCSMKITDLLENRFK